MAVQPVVAGFVLIHLGNKRGTTDAQSQPGSVARPQVSVGLATAKRQSSKRNATAAGSSPANWVPPADPDAGRRP